MKQLRNSERALNRRRTNEKDTLVRTAAYNRAFRKFVRRQTGLLGQIGRTFSKQEQCLLGPEPTSCILVHPRKAVSPLCPRHRTPKPRGCLKDALGRQRF